MLFVLFKYLTFDEMSKILLILTCAIHMINVTAI